MRVLWLGTKPPWPPIDGGRVLALETVRCLGAAGAAVTFVSPCPASTLESVSDQVSGLCEAILVPARWPALRSLRAVTQSLSRGEPLTLEKHRSRLVQNRVSELLSSRSFDVVHVEQLHSLSHLQGVSGRRPPAALRAHNVESDLWRQTARFRRPGLAFLLRREATRLARSEGQALRSVDSVVALTSDDQERLGQLAGGKAVVKRIAAPFVADLPAAGLPLAGRPAVVLFGSQGWRPNADAQRWFLREVWPRVLERFSGARLHVFGGRLDARISGVTAHPPPARSVEAFAPNATLVVPLRIASGVRIKILEAWSRGIPVVASPEACRGLESGEGPAVWPAASPADYVEGLAAMEKADGRSQTIAQGREILRTRHAPEVVAEQLMGLYLELCARDAGSGE